MISLAERARLGGLRRIQLYGNPGTPEGRSRGGRTTTSLFHQNPSIAKVKGFIVRKDIKCPRKSLELAEFMGIMLGDGGLPGSHQFTISFNYMTDLQHAMYVGKILKKLFSVDYHIHRRKDSNGADMVVNSSNLVDFLVKHGFTAGNKVGNQIDVPKWIRNKLEYSIACIRGLMDTDGSLYRHKYYSGGKEYIYLKLCFTNRSKPLVNFMLNTLRELNFKAYLVGDNVLVYDASDVKRYFVEIGSHSLKHTNKFRKHFN